MAQCEACSGALNARGICIECGAVDHHTPDPPIRVNGSAPPTAREEVAQMDPAERKALMDEVRRSLADVETKMAARAAALRSPSPRKWNGDVTEAIGDPQAEAHLPYPRHTVEDAQWRAERAASEMRRLVEYCEREGIDWRTGRELGARVRPEEVAG